ncbi:MAG: dihydroneopterin aldolase [Candidatus Zixiibacteriota bacterium]
MDTIRIMNMSFYGFHGVTSAEKETGRRFEVDCELKVDVAEPGQTDMLDDTIDYNAVYKRIEAVVTGKAYALVEKLAAEMAKILLEAFPVYEVTLRVRKLTPPIAGQVDYIEVEVTRSQPDTDKLLA